LAAAQAPAKDLQTLMIEDGDGTRTRESVVASASELVRVNSPAEQDPADGGVIWHNTLTDAIIQSTSISAAADRLCAGTYLNPPREVELIPLEGDGTPDWVFPGTDFRVAASRNGDVIVGVDKLTSGVTLYRWHPESSAFDWSYNIPSCSIGGVRSVVVSPDASTIALSVTMQNPQFARLYLFDPDSPVPIATCDASEGTFARNLDITADGRYIAFIAGADAYVFDRDTQTTRWSGSMGASNDPIAISGDGNYLAYGWTMLYMREWTGSTYDLLWTAPGGAFRLRSCRFSFDASTFVAGWYHSSTHLQNRIQLYEVPSSTPLWTHLNAMGSGGYQDVPYEIAITATGGHLVVGSWGDQANTNAEVQIFERASSEPVLTVDTPGSVFSVDIAEDSRGGVYAAACGKHVHANQTGRGGDLYSIRVTDPSAAGEDGLWADQIRLEMRPNPCVTEAAIRLVLAHEARTQIGVFAPDGRLLRVLDRGVMSAGTHPLQWDGTAASGRAAEPGVYFLRVDAGAHSAAARIILAE
jgi:hypothetical protein